MVAAAFGSSNPQPCLPFWNWAPSAEQIPTPLVLISAQHALRQSALATHPPVVNCWPAASRVSHQRTEENSKQIQGVIGHIVTIAYLETCSRTKPWRRRLQARIERHCFLMGFRLYMKAAYPCRCRRPWHQRCWEPGQERRQQLCRAEQSILMFRYGVEPVRSDWDGTHKLERW